MEKCWYCGLKTFSKLSICMLPLSCAMWRGKRKDWKEEEWISAPACSSDGEVDLSLSHDPCKFQCQWQCNFQCLIKLLPVANYIVPLQSSKHFFPLTSFWYLIWPQMKLLAVQLFSNSALITMMAHWHRKHSIISGFQPTWLETDHPPNPSWLEVFSFFFNRLLNVVVSIHIQL